MNPQTKPVKNQLMQNGITETLADSNVDAEPLSVFESVIFSHSEPLLPYRIEKRDIRIIILEQLLKGVAFCYLAFGFVAAVTYFTRQIIVDTRDANLFWKFIGMFNCFFVFGVVILIILSKTILHVTESFEKSENEEKQFFFFLAVVCPACPSLFHLLFTILRNEQYFYKCAVLSDILLPLSRFVFVFAGVVIVGDLINNRLKPGITAKIRFLYQYTAVLAFVTCINNAVFDFLDDQSYRIQILRHNTSGGNEIFCYQWHSTNPFQKISDDIFEFCHVFTTILSLTFVIYFIRPLGQFWDQNANAKKDRTSGIVSDTGCHDQRNPHKIVPRFAALAIIVSVVIFVICTLNMILGIIKRRQDMDTEIIEKVLKMLMLPIYLFCAAINVYMLKSLNANFHLTRNWLTSPTPVYFIWISLAGEILNILRFLILEIYNISVLKSDLFLNSIGVVSQLVNVVEAVLQSIMMDYMFRINWNCKLRLSNLSSMYYCIVFLISINAGNLVTDFYHQSIDYKSDLVVGTFQKIVWGVFSTLCNPFILTFRGISLLYLISFINNMNFDGIEH